MGDYVSTAFPDYQLYVYGEGEQAEQYRKGMFEGLPVLFIPGNGGSFKQGLTLLHVSLSHEKFLHYIFPIVRSLGSVAYRKAIDSKKGVKLDFFTMDFNEELSALYGGILDEQVKFTKEAIKKVSSLYKRKEGEVSVILIGHSMVRLNLCIVFHL